MSRRALLSWSGGKDSAHALHLLRAAGAVEVCGLLTTVSAADGRIPIHEVSADLVAAQAAAIGLPLIRVPLPDGCDNVVYAAVLRAALRGAAADGVECIAFGDLFLEEIRAFRERLLEGTGVEPLFPLWGRDTAELAQEIVASGVRAVITSVDTTQLDARFCGQEVDAALLGDLPAGVDPCAENGEFHSFVWDGPELPQPVPVHAGATSQRERFAVCELSLAGQVMRR